jgi:hypothetical protein
MVVTIVREIIIIRNIRFFRFSTRIQYYQRLDSGPSVFLTPRTKASSFSSRRARANAPQSSSPFDEPEPAPSSSSFAPNRAALRRSRLDRFASPTTLMVFFARPTYAAASASPSS